MIIYGTIPRFESIQLYLNEFEEVMRMCELPTYKALQNQPSCRRIFACCLSMQYPLDLTHDLREQRRS